MNINKYRKYIRDMELTDNELTELIKTVINDIARDTLIFKDIFVFNLESCFDYYDINILYSTSQILRDNNVTNIEISSTLNTPQDLSNYIDSVTTVSVNNTICETDSGTAKVDLTVTDSSINTFLNINDIIYSEYDNNKNVLLNKKELLSIYSRWFYQITNSKLMINKVNLFSDTIYTENSISFDIPLVTIINIVPDLDNISEEDEYTLEKAIIEGLKYFLSDSYMNVQNTQTANILYQRYYSSKRQLKYNYSNNINLFDRYKRF